ncbi:MAG TPA: exosortase A, partial [Burkholderiales bacterium]|nr:exosortase A [Burkholderiales bacterium]
MRPSDLPGHNLRLPAADSLRALTWRRALGATLLALLTLLGCYWESVVTLVQTWSRSGTYMHGFIVFPVSVWLIWRRRTELATIAPRPFLPGLLMLGGLSVLWLLGHLATVQTFQEFALVASIPLLLWTMLGTEFAKRCWFALVFMMFAWPFGEFLIPPLIDRTADFTVAALRFTGVPVFRQGNTFAIPTGQWSVVEACSGVRYLIASICAGSAFAYLTYRSWSRRLAFMAAAVVVPIVANWVRAYLIVLIGHLSGNRLAAGVDHLIYGWVFFGLVMLLLFYVAGRWSETAAVDPERPSAEPAGVASNGRRWIVGAAAAMALIAIGPGLAFALRLAEPAQTVVELSTPNPSPPWQSIDGSLTSWEPPFRNPSAALQQTYRSGSQQIELVIDLYRDQRTGSKLLTFMSTTLADYDP